MHYDPLVEGWLCSSSTGHRCFFKHIDAVFSPEDVISHLAGDTSTLKVMPTQLKGDPLVAWAAFDDDGDPWAHVIRWHDGRTYHLAYLVTKERPVPDDFFAVMTTLVFGRLDRPKPKDSTEGGVFL